MKIFLTMMFFLFIQTASANFAEFFGASSTTQSIGNQSNFDIYDPSNNYYFPSLLGFSDKVTANTGVNSTATKFEPITNIVTQNSTNSSVTNETYSNVNTDYLKYYNFNLHLSLPIGRDHFGTLGFSLFAPIGHIIEGDSGHPQSPEYVMYRARYKRTTAYINFAKSWDENLAMSLGAYLGYQATANANLNLGLNGTQYGTSGRVRSKVDPSLATLFSLSYRFNKALFSIAYQQEMQSNLRAETSGELSNPVNLPFLSNIDTLLFYDPHIFRIGNSYLFDDFSLFGTIEYQMWEKYKPSKIKVTKVSGTLEGSRDYEIMKLRNIFVPKAGLQYKLTDSMAVDLGFSLRQSPLDNDFSGSGNSIDTDTYNYSAGAHYIMNWAGHLIKLSSSIMYQDLKKKVVRKSSGLETGGNGYRIGYPGYTIDGTVLSGTFGLNFTY